MWYALFAGVSAVVLTVFIHYMYYSNKIRLSRKRILFLTDPSNEIDDECAIRLNMDTESNAGVYPMCVAGKSSVDKTNAEQEAKKRVQHLRKLFVEFEM
jgi:hypothetical protein